MLLCIVMTDRKHVLTVHDLACVLIYVAGVFNDEGWLQLSLRLNYLHAAITRRLLEVAKHRVYVHCLQQSDWL